MIPRINIPTKIYKNGIFCPNKKYSNPETNIVATTSTIAIFQILYL